MQEQEVCGGVTVLPAWLAGLVCGVLMWLWGSREMWVRQ